MPFDAADKDNWDDKIPERLTITFNGKTSSEPGTRKIFASFHLTQGKESEQRGLSKQQIRAIMEKYRTRELVSNHTVKTQLRELRSGLRAIARDERSLWLEDQAFRVSRSVQSALRLFSRKPRP